MSDNLGLSPVGRITNSVNTTNNTIGSYGGTTGVPVASIDYTIVGGTMMITCTAGTGVSITLKDGSGNTVASALTTLTAQTLPVGFRINFGAFSVSPTLTVFGV